MSLRLGVIGRSEARGLGYQSLDVARHLAAERVLLVEPTPQRWATHPEWYDGLDVTRLAWSTNDGLYRLDEGTTRRWLAGLHVVYAAETLYDWRLAGWAADAGVAVVVHVNPELLSPVGRATPGVTWWAPTPWLLERLPDGTRVVAQPVAAADAHPTTPTEGPVRFLHVVGHAAHLDRNGTRVLAQAVSRLRVHCELTVTGQDGRLPADLRARDHRVTVRCVPGGLEDRWDAYTGDVLVLPRRYGGLCLPAQEAMAAGMAVVLTDVVPNDIWPGPRVAHRGRTERPMLGGSVPVTEPSGNALRAVMEHLATHPQEVEAHKADARAWADGHSWEALGDTWRAELAKAAGR